MMQVRLENKMHRSRHLLIMWLLVIIATSGTASSPFDGSLTSAWEDFQRIYNKTYSESEAGARRRIFEENVEFITKHNLEADLGDHGYWLGINKFGDMTQEEYVNLMTAPISTPDVSNETGRFTDMSSPYGVPKEIDWRRMGYVTPIKDQGVCNACWAFVAVGVLEALHMKQTGKLVSLSEQNLIDCSSKYGTHGCTGGHPYAALQYVSKNKGIDTERSYPYQQREMHQCRFRRNQIGADCSQPSLVKTLTEESMKVTVARLGPVGVAIDANSPKFRFYRSGVYGDRQCSQKIPNHAILIVGYGKSGGKDYWLVKNSYGTNWGMRGYGLIVRNKNTCGIGNEMTFAE